MIWLFFIALFLVLLIVVYNSVPWAERKALFYPTKNRRWEPQTSYDNVYIDVKNPTKVYHRKPNSKNREYINGWFFNEFPGNTCICYSHGNSGNIKDRKYIVDVCRKFKLNLFVFDYRGYGDSSGEPSKRNLRQDGEAAYKYLTKYNHINPRKIIVWGESLGGYVAVWIASKFRCKSLILLSTFSGLDDAINNYFASGMGKSLAHGYSSLVSLRYDIMPSRKYLHKVRCPVAIVHSTEDDIIPYRCAKINYDSVSHDSKILIPIKGGHSAPEMTIDDLTDLFNFCNIQLPVYSEVSVENMLDEIRTVAEKNHNFMD